MPDMLNFSRGPEGISSSPGASSTAASSSDAIPLRIPLPFGDTSQEKNCRHRLLPGESRCREGGVSSAVERRGLLFGFWKG